MNTLLKLAWRSIWRNRRRTLISMSAAAFGLFLVIFYSGIVGGAIGNAKNQLDLSGMGHVELYAPTYRARPQASTAIPDAEALLAKLPLPPGSESGTRIVARGLATSARGSEGVELHGVDWEREALLSTYSRTVTAGERPKADDTRGVLIGDKLAERLKVTVGSKVRLMVQRADGEMGADLFRVRGIFHSVSAQLAQRRVLVSQKAAEQLVGVEGAAHQIVIQLPDAQLAESTATALRGVTGPGVEVLSFSQLVPTLKAMEDLQANATTIAAVFVYFLVGLGILNTALMSVLERTREFGVMLALGTRPRRMVSLVLAESFWIATLSVVIGLAAGLAVTWYGSKEALLDYSRSMGEAMDWGGMVISSAFKTRFSIGEALRASAFVYLMALLVGLYPAWRVSRLHPSEALRRN